MNLPSYKIDGYDYKERRGSIPAINEYLHVTSQGYATVSGKRIFITPNLFNQSPYHLSAEEERKSEIVYDYAFTDTDSVEISIPDGYVLESVPKDIMLSTPYGEHSIRYKVEGNRILMYRHHRQPKIRFPKTEYPAFAKYLNDIYKADRARMVFVKK